jgi:hypothetical protein
LSKLFKREYCNGLAKKNLHLGGIIFKIFFISLSLVYLINIEEPLPERHISYFLIFF